MLAAVLLAMFFCNQIRGRTKCHIFYEWVIKGNRIKKSEKKISNNNELKSLNYTNSHEICTRLYLVHIPKVNTKKKEKYICMPPCRGSPLSFTR